MRHSAHLAKALFAALWFLLTIGCGIGERADLLILVRANDPISVAIGRYYASARRVPAHRILELELSAIGERNEIDTATFASKIAAPIESYLATQDPEGEISILVTTSGIPLRIGHCEESQPQYPRDCQSAAVDAALAGLGRLSPGPGLLAENANPYFGDPRSFDRFRRDQPDARLRFLVARITGPSMPQEAQSSLPVALRRLIDRPNATSSGAAPLWQIVANAPSASRAAASAALFDPIGERLRPRGHRVCDACPTSTEASPPAGIVVQGHPESVATATLPERLAFPGLVIALGGMEDLPAGEAAASDPPADEDPFERFLASWLARGARVISTHLGDPSLSGVTRPANQLQAWAEGRTAIEAHFNSVPHLGWLNVFIGDPLLVLAESSRAESGDLDADGIPDERDNCLTVSNPAQRDSNHDRIGNRCDPDVDNDGRVDTSWGQIYPLDARGDLEAIALTARNGPYNPDHDLDGDGQVNENDLALAQLWLFRSPGPSGYTAAIHD